MTEEDRMTV